MIKISASTNPPKEINLLDYVLQVQNSGVDYVHCDVMDGQFVKTECMPISKIKEVSFGCLLPVDVHLMVANPMWYIKQILPLKVNYITVHYESFKTPEELQEAIHLIRSKGVLVGLSIKPNTSLTKIMPLLNQIDMLMIMSVEPGKSGQEFLPSTIEKFKTASDYRKQHNLNFKLQADGGVNEHNLPSLIQAGVDVVALGSALYNSQNKQMYVNKLKSL